MLPSVAPDGTVMTERLRLRAWRPAEDAEAFAELNGAPEVMRFIPPFRPLTRAESDDVLARLARHWDQHGYGLWALDMLEGERRCIGFAGLAIPAFLPAVLPAVEIGWRLAPAWWGLGLATEAARATVGHARDALGLASVVSIIDERNGASLRVAEKLGMRRGRDRLHPVTRRRLRVMELDLRVATLTSCSPSPTR
jgi:RimJ/RimL family protein N-acetyltransferase